MARRSKFNVDQSAAGKLARTIRHAGKDVLCDSKAEARKLAELVLLEKVGAISGLALHPKFPLTVNGKPVAHYEADAAYWDVQGGRQVVLDIKGVETDAFKLKAKLFRAIYPKDELRVVKT
jgi:hypothetical protein